MLLSGDKEKGKDDERENNYRALGGSGMTFHSKQSMYQVHPRGSHFVVSNID